MTKQSVPNFFFTFLPKKVTRRDKDTGITHCTHCCTNTKGSNTFMFFFANIHLQEHVYKRMLLSFLYELPLNILSYKDREFEERDKAGMQRGSW